MTRRFSVARVVGVSILLAALPIAVAAQTPARDRPTEQDRLAELTRRSNAIDAHLELARTYLDEKRFGDAERMLTSALALVRQERIKSQPAAAVPPGAPGTQAPLRVGGNIPEPKKIKDVRPVYPDIALTAGVQGIVILEVIIDETGGVRNAKVLRSIALLDQAALDAVYQWRFTPTLLNGAPVEVIMTVTVNFVLGPISPAANSAPR
jgi:TonB family protein